MNELEIISTYLIENNYTSSYNDSVNFISAMSDDWIYAILTEEVEDLYEKKLEKVKRTINPQTGRSEWKIVPKKRTPLTQTITNKQRGRIDKTPEGDWKVTPAKKYKKTVLTTAARTGLIKQGGHHFRPDLVRKGLLGHIPPQHQSTPEFSSYRPHSHGPGGKARGKRKERGAKPSGELSPVRDFIRHKDRMKEYQSDYLNMNNKYMESPKTVDDKSSPLIKARVRAAARRRQKG